MPLELIPADRALLRALLAQPAATLGALCSNGGEIASIVAEVAGANLSLYDRKNCEAPWIGYFARDGGDIVGTCSFTSPPVEGAVEIAYFTLPPHEGRGIATTMAGLLIAIAFREPELRTLIAHTLPAESSSTKILRKHGFQRDGLATDPDAGDVWRWRKARPE
jgi:RimJ/RimL family protein N-acetyltransferase